MWTEATLSSKMKLFNAIAAAAVVGASFIDASPAKASGCFTSTAVVIIGEVVRGGGSPQEAVDAAVAEGVINSKGCITRVRGRMRSLPSTYGDVLRGMNW